MKLRESILISATADQVWAPVADPKFWTEWNPKVRAVHRDRTGPLVVGETFRAEFELGGRVTPARIETVVLDPNQRLVLHQHYDHDGRSRLLEIIFELEPKGTALRLTQIVDFRYTGIPWLFQVLIAWVHRFGRPSGKASLEDLRARFLTAT
jgi:uncharacterized protein YndB with AHSA1/START domain